MWQEKEKACPDCDGVRPLAIGQAEDSNGVFSSYYDKCLSLKRNGYAAGGSLWILRP